jgi:hypothetical protein
MMRWQQKRKKKNIERIGEANPAVKRHLKLELEIKSLKYCRTAYTQVAISYTHNYYEYFRRKVGN